MMDLLSLPPEIFPNIFGFLSLEDRKNVRLTCQLFRDACDGADIVKRERFFFHFGHFEEYTNTSTFVKYLGNCKRIRPRTEFRAVCLTRLPLKIWEDLGNRITSLLLDHCYLNDEVLARILSHCSELVEFHVNVPDEVILFASEPNSLDRLIKRRIERVKLRTFKFFSRRPLSDNTYRKIFKILPNIKTFGRGLYREGGPEIRRNFFVDKEPASSSVLLPPFVENFVYTGIAYSAWMVPHIDQPTLKFKELEFMLRIRTHEDMKNTFKFFSSQTELEKIDLVIDSELGDGSNNSFVRTIIFQIITKSTKLTAMRVLADRKIEFSESEFAEFVATVPKNLKSLDISPIECVFQPSSTLDLPSVDYRKLTHLKLEFSTSKWMLASEILKRCCSLQCLVVMKVNKDLLECILGNHTKLRKLSLEFNHHLDDTLMKEISSIRLQNLERLDVNLLPFMRTRYGLGFPPVDIASLRRRHRCSIMSSSNVAAAFVSKLDSPKLKVFRCMGTKDERGEMCLGPTAEDTIVMLNSLQQKMPLLETLILRSELPTNQYHLYCGRFKKLRYMTALSSSACTIRFLNTDELLQLFEACPSLTIVVDYCYSPPGLAHFYNRTTRSVVTYSFESYQTLCEILDVQWFF